MSITKLIFLSTFFTTLHSFVPSFDTFKCHKYLIHDDRLSSRSFSSALSSSSKENEKGIMDIISMRADIPEEFRDEIFKAEANTPAARDRTTRIILYAIMALLGVSLSSMNVFLSSVRENAGASFSDLSSIEDLGFGWVGSNPLTSFFLLNKIGGGMALIAAGFGGTMVELEVSWKV
jgi:hypothetical protein